MWKFINRIAAAFLSGVITLTLVALPLGGADRTTSNRSNQQADQIRSDLWRQPLTEKQKVLLLLNRITFGPRPGDVERIEKMGLAAFLNQQLHPDWIDDSLVHSKLATLETLTMTPTQLAEDFPTPKGQATRASAEAPGCSPGVAICDAIRQRRKRYGSSASQLPLLRASAGPPIDDACQYGGSWDGMSKGDNLPQGPRFILMQLAQEEVLRAVYSQRQLQEVMVHFWMNHFNIYW